MATSAGKVSEGNGGQTDKGRGSAYTFPYSKDQRKTGKVSNGGSTGNPNDIAGRSRPKSK